MVSCCRSRARGVRRQYERNPPRAHRLARGAPNWRRARKRWIEEDDVPVPCCLATQPGQRGNVLDLARGIKLIRLCAQYVCCPPVVLDQRREFRAARQRFEREGAGTGEQVQNPGTPNIGIEPVEQRLSNTIHGRP